MIARASINLCCGVILISIGVKQLHIYMVALGIALGLVLILTGTAFACENVNSNPTTMTTAKSENSIFCLLNKERTKRGLKRLHLNQNLGTSSRFQSRDMEKRNYFEHERRGGPTLTQRIRRTGYLDNVSAWSIGENIAWGTSEFATPKSLVNAWMHSTGHRRNILRKAFKDVGVGLVMGAPEKEWDDDKTAVLATTDFGMHSF